MEPWVKVERVTAGKTQVRKIAKRLGIARAHAFGCCVILWMHADAETADGFIPHLDADEIDDIVGTVGFADALVEVEWLRLTPEGAYLPKYESHMGQSAKARAQNSKDVAKHRERNGKGAASGACKDRPLHPCKDASLPEEKREEDIREERKPEAAPPESAQETPDHEEFFLSRNSPGEKLTSARAVKPKTEPLDPEATFDGFWRACSRKSGKAKCRTAWAKAKQSIAAEKRLAPDEAARWLTGRMEIFSASPAGQAGRFTPHPATWLNQGRYDDDEATWQDEDRRETQKAVDPRGNMANAARAIASIGNGTLKFPVGDRGPPRIASISG